MTRIMDGFCNTSLLLLLPSPLLCHKQKRRGGSRQRRQWLQTWIVLMAALFAAVQFIVLSTHLGKEPQKDAHQHQHQHQQQTPQSSISATEAASTTSNALLPHPHPQQSSSSSRSITAAAKQKPPSHYDQTTSEEKKKRRAKTTTRHSSLFVPLLQRNVTATQLPLPVVLYPYATMGSLGKQDATVALDGLLESPFLQLVSNITADTSDLPNLVWVADQGAARAPPPIWCRNFVQIIRDVQQAQQQRRQSPTTATTTATTNNNNDEHVIVSWPVHIVQVSLDSPTFNRCKAAERLFAPGHVRFFKRSLVVERHWNKELHWVDTGHYIDNDATREGLLFHLGMPVRTDIVQELDRLLADKHNTTLSSPIEELLPRRTDVAHFWPLQDDRLEEVNRDDGRLRDAVSHAIFDLHNVTIPLAAGTTTTSSSTTPSSSKSLSRRRSLQLFIDTVGAGREAGRNTVQMEYLHKLLDTKIVVVAQRDSWEDHYRLLEGIAAGACVFTDVMITLPKGFKNGTSVVEYSSERNLQDLLLYYLTHDEERTRIAKAGRDIAMRRHRSWHRMEEVVFGRPVSVCELGEPLETCNPWVVHARDIYPSSTIER